MSTIDMALENTTEIALTGDECFSLLGAIEYRIKYLESVIETESGKNPGIAESATADKKRLEDILERLGF